MFLAETIWQQQEGTLMAIEGTLWWIAVVVTIMALTGFEIAARLTRLRNIGNAVLEEQKKTNAMLQYLNERAYDEAIKKKPVAPPPARKNEPEVYRLD